MTPTYRMKEETQPPEQGTGVAHRGYQVRGGSQGGGGPSRG